MLTFTHRILRQAAAGVRLPATTGIRTASRA